MTWPVKHQDPLCKDWVCVSFPSQEPLFHYHCAERQWALRVSSLNFESLCLLDESTSQEEMATVNISYLQTEPLKLTARKGALARAVLSSLLGPVSCFCSLSIFGLAVASSSCPVLMGRIIFARWWSVSWHGDNEQSWK